VPQCPGNIHGENQYPTEQLKELERQSKWDGNQKHNHFNNSSAAPRRQSIPRPSHEQQVEHPANVPIPPSGNDSAPLSGNANKNSHCNGDDLARLCREGGVKLFDYLIQFAHSTDNNELPVEYEPDLSKVCEWQYKDIT